MTDANTVTASGQRGDTSHVETEQGERLRGYSPLLRPEWEILHRATLDDFSGADWDFMNKQRAIYRGEEQANQALRLLSCSQDDPTFGYEINNYGHCLQAATLAFQAGCDEETVVVALLHDIAFVTSTDMHGDVSASLLGAYISEKNYWMLRRHAIFQQLHIHGVPGLENNERDKWLGHPHFEWTAEFVAKYDQNSTRADIQNMPLEAFVPMVQKIFARDPKPIMPD
jgi:predicted HD phosphohydrolase